MWVRVEVGRSPDPSRTSRSLSTKTEEDGEDARRTGRKEKPKTACWHCESDC